MDNAKPDESFLAELDSIPDYEEKSTEEIHVVDELIPAEVTVKVRFKSGYERNFIINLPITSEIFDGTLTKDNFLDYIGSAYSFSEGSFLALPTDSIGSHVFIELDSTDYIEVVR